jgi:hypothetical protein
MTTEGELVKLISSAQTSCAKAEEGDAAEEKRAVDILRVLAKAEVTAALLGKTDAGKKLRKLCKHASAGIAGAANAAVEAWKDAVRGEKARQASGKLDDAAAPSDAAGAVDGSQPRLPSLASQLSGAGSDLPEPASTSGGAQQPPFDIKGLPKAARSGDSTRDKIRDLLVESLAPGLVDADMREAVYSRRPALLAVEIEEAMFTQSGGVNAKYKVRPCGH